MEYQRPEINPVGNALTFVLGGKDKPEVPENVQTYVSTVAAYQVDE